MLLPVQTGCWLLFLVSPRKSNQKEGDPGLPRRQPDINLAAYPSFRNRNFSSVVSWECPCGIDSPQTAGLRNSHDPLPGHLLKHNQRLASLLA